MRIKPRTLLISLTAAVTLYALLGFLLLPALGVYLINKQFEKRATVPAHLEAIRFNPFTLELTLRNLHMGEPDAPQVAFDRLYANLQADSLWSGALHLRDVELEQARVQVLFAEDGSLNLTRLLVLPEPEEKPKQTEDSGPFPLRIDRLALLGNSLQFQDLRPAEPVEFGYDAVDIELTRLSTLPEDNAQMQVSARGPYGALITWEGEVRLLPLKSSGRLQIDQIHLSTFWPYVRDHLPLNLGSGDISLDTRYELDLAETTELRLSDTYLQLSQLALTSADQPSLQLESLEISDSTLDLARREARLGRVTSQGLQLQASRLADGQIDWLKLLERSDGAQQPDAAETPQAAPEEDSEPAPPWRLLVDQAQLQGYRLQLTDHQPSTPVTIEVGPLNLSLNDFDSQSEGVFELSLDTLLNQEARLAIQGTAGINPVRAALQVETGDIDLTLAQAYLAPLVNLELRSGRLNSQLQVKLDQLQPLQLDVGGQASIRQLHVVDGPAKRDLLKWSSMDLNELHYRGSRLDIGRVALQQPYVRFIINRDMSTNFSDLVRAQPEREAPAAEGEPFGIRIGGISIADGSANFADFSLTPNFATGIEQLNGSIGTLDNQRTQAARVDLQGKVDRYAPVTIRGELTPFDPLNSLDIATSFKNVELTTLTPYSGKFAGYRIRKGRLNLDLHYRINQGQLQADNRVLLEDLQLGERVDSPDAVDLPVRLALALLKDTRGNIDIELPVAGDLNNPEFSVMPIIWQTLRNLVMRATQAPFKFIAGLAGGSDADLSQLGFSAGSSELDANATQVLSTLAQALSERPQLALEVEGVSAAELDGPQLAAARLERELRQLAASEMRRPPEDPSTLELDERDRRKLIRTLHEQLQLAEPEEWQALSRDERTEARSQALIAHWSDNPVALRRLAQQRAAAIKNWLVDEGRLEPERIHLLDVDETGKADQGQIATRLQLGIR